MPPELNIKKIEANSIKFKNDHFRCRFDTKQYQKRGDFKRPYLKLKEVSLKCILLNSSMSFDYSASASSGLVQLKMFYFVEGKQIQNANRILILKALQANKSSLDF